MAAQPTPRSDNSTPFAWVRFAGAIVVIAALAYSNSFEGSFVLDDESGILRNESLRSLGTPAVFTAPASAGSAGRPLANLSLAFNYAISGTHVWSYHAGNLLVHICAALTLFGVVRRTLRLPRLQARFGAASSALAAAIAIAWSVHPLTTATVNYVSQRTEQLMALCYLLALYALIRGATAPRRRWLVASVLACLAATASKEVAITAPVLIALYDRALVAGSFAALWRLRWRYYLALGATWLVLGALLATSEVGERGVGFGRGVSAAAYAMSACKALVLYLQLAVWPHPLVFDYGWAFANAADVWPQVALVVLLLVATARALRRNTPVALIGAWFFGVLAPTSSFVPVLHQPIAESRMYLPLAGIVTGMILLLHLRLGNAARPVLFATVAALAALTFQRNPDYRDPVELWRDTVAKQPLNARAHSNLAGALLRADRPAEALRAAREAVRLYPAYHDARINLGAALEAEGRLEEAVEQYRAATEIDPEHAAAHANLGAALAALGRAGDAREHLRRALQLDPTLPKAHNDLGVLLLEAGRAEEAIAHQRTAIRLAPDMADAHYNLGNCLARLQRYGEAIEAFEAAVRLQPRFAKARNNLGVVLLLAGRAADAVPHLEAAVQLDPSHNDARRHLELARRAAATAGPSAR